MSEKGAWRSLGASWLLALKSIGLILSIAILGCGIVNVYLNTTEISVTYIDKVVTPSPYDWRYRDRDNYRDTTTQTPITTTPNLKQWKYEPEVVEYTSVWGGAIILLAAALSFCHNSRTPSGIGCRALFYTLGLLSFLLSIGIGVGTICWVQDNVFRSIYRIECPNRYQCRDTIVESQNTFNLHLIKFLSIAIIVLAFVNATVHIVTFLLQSALFCCNHIQLPEDKKRKSCCPCIFSCSFGGRYPAAIRCNCGFGENASAEDEATRVVGYERLSNEENAEESNGVVNT